MNKKSLTITTAAVFVTFFALEFLIHGGLLAGIYKQTASVWRPEPEMKSLMPFMTAGQFLFSVFFAALFARGYEKGKPGAGQGLRYGLWIAFLFSPMNALAWYVILPIPGMLAVYWFLFGLAEMAVLGWVAGLAYKP